MGLDFYQFETHVRDFVFELVEPTIQKASEDHKLVTDLSVGYEAMRQKVETLLYESSKFQKKTVTMNEFHLRVAELVITPIMLRLYCRNETSRKEARL